MIDLPSLQTIEHLFDEMQPTDLHGQLGFHSARRKFANDLKATTNLRDLAYIGGWKSPVTLLTVYQQPDLEVQRASLAGRKNVGAAPQSLAN
jgi:hypothetical protein